jgi:hypothetical protein
MQARKPGPVPQPDRNQARSYHLSSPDVAIRINRPTRDAPRPKEEDIERYLSKEAPLIWPFNS